MSKESGFELHSQLAADCVVVGDLALCRVLLMNDSNYPWCILVPRRAGLRELYELDEQDASEYSAESRAVAIEMMAAFDGGKFNIAALGNMVPQLHVHHIVRREDDPAWPKPVWGAMPAQPYDEKALTRRVELLRDALSHCTGAFVVP